MEQLEVETDNVRNARKFFSGFSRRQPLTPALRLSYWIGSTSNSPPSAMTAS